MEQLAQAQNTPIEAIIEKMVPEVEATRLSNTIKKMRAKGILAPHGRGEVMEFKRSKVAQKPVLETIIEERERAIA